MSDWPVRGCEIRVATGADAAELHRLEVKIFGPDAWSAGALVAELAREDASESIGRHGFVASVEGNVAGYALSRRTDDVCDIVRVAVSAAFRRQGLGTALVQALLEQARVESCARALLEVASDNTAALECYAQLGFGVLDRRARYYSGRVDALVLVKVLQR